MIKWYSPDNRPPKWNDVLHDSLDAKPKTKLTKTYKINNIHIKVRELVQISASGHTDADWSSTNFIRFSYILHCAYLTKRYITYYYWLYTNAVEPPLTATSLQPSFFSSRLSIHSLLVQPLDTGHLSTMAIFFCPHGGHCGEVQLYT